jgi:glyoxylase I family protein
MRVRATWRTPHVKTHIEHVNVTVADAESSATLFAGLFGWSVRWSGAARDGGRSVHVGDTDHYLAFYSPPAGDGEETAWPKGMPLNHVGIEVEDLAEIERRVAEAGLTPFGHGDYEPGRRFYFLDPNGIEFEVVSYADSSGSRN